MNLDRLRRETAQDHEDVEGLMPFMAPDLTRPRYVRALSRLYGFVKGWELWANACSPLDLRSFLQDRNRSPLLARDLYFFGDILPPDVWNGSDPFPETRPSFLGALYVMEGSTLGGRYIAKRVEHTLQLEPGQGNAYFVGAGNATEAMWREVQTLLRGVPEHDEDLVLDAAKTMFREYAVWMHAGSPSAQPAAPVEGDLQHNA